MKIIATTNGGFLIEASKSEVQDIMKSTIGSAPDLSVGTILPAHDYAAKVRECKKFKESSEFQTLKRYAKSSATKINDIIDKFEALGEEN